jgi:hypothetical protein
MDPHRGMGFPLGRGTFSIDLLELMSSAALETTSYAEQLEQLLGDAFAKIQHVDSKERFVKSFHQRHRLAVLLEVLKSWERGVKQRSPIVPIAALSEIAATIRLFQDAQDDALWPKLVRSLVNPTDYAHAVILLSLAVHLHNAGAEVFLQPENHVTRSCDLVVNYSQEVGLNIEVKAPRDLQWLDDPLTPKRAMEHLKKQFGNAGTGPRGQLSPPTPGVLAIGVLAADSRTLDLLRASAEKHLLFPPGDYSHIMGVLFISLGSSMDVSAPTIMGNRFQLGARVDTKTHVDLVHNPHYTGAIRWRMSE